MEKVIFISPMYNASPHLKELVESLKEQTNTNWEHILIDDLSTDDSFEVYINLTEDDDRFSAIRNKGKKWALKNVVNTARLFQKQNNVIIAILDADDCLCNERTVELLLNAYDDTTDTVWTAHTWDINGMNISKNFPENKKINPYQYAWCSSHLKTFRSSLIANICDENFKNLSGEWFKRGYDQALYLPLLYVSRKSLYLDEVCYLYRINSKSIKVRQWSEKEQMDAVRLVRARGFIKNQET